MRYIISLCMYMGLMVGAVWGAAMPPTVCNFGDPAFEKLSHQKVSFDIPEHFMVGQENFVIIKLEKPTLPSGYMVSVLTDIIRSPSSKPEVQGWYPKTSIKPLEKGEHELKITVNLIYKGS